MSKADVIEIEGDDAAWRFGGKMTNRRTLKSSVPAHPDLKHGDIVRHTVKIRTSSSQ